MPLEAAFLDCLVIACNNGATLETIAHEYTGFLLPACPRVWGSQIKEILEAKDETIENKMKETAVERTKNLFGIKVFNETLELIMSNME